MRKHDPWSSCVRSGSNPPSRRCFRGSCAPCRRCRCGICSSDCLFLCMLGMLVGPGRGSSLRCRPEDQVIQGGSGKDCKESFIVKPFDLPCNSTTLRTNSPGIHNCCTASFPPSPKIGPPDSPCTWTVPVLSRSPETFPSRRGKVYRGRSR